MTMRAEPPTQVFKCLLRMTHKKKIKDTVIKEKIALLLCCTKLI